MSSKEGLIAQLKEEWSGLEFKDLTDDAGKDERRAALLHFYQAKGLHQRDLAKAISKTQSYVSQQLRYQRFLITEVIKIPEFRFRQYWNQCSDPLIVKGGRGPTREAAIAAHEAVVFPAIAAMVQAGKLPVKFPKPVQPKTVEEVRATADVFKTVRKELQTIYEPRLQKIVKELKGLLRDDPARYRPAYLHDYADAFDKVMHQLDALFRKLGTQDTRRPAPRSVTPQTSINMTLEDTTHG